MGADGPRMTDRLERRAVELYEQGLRIRAVAEDTGIARTTVLRILKSHGVVMRYVNSQPGAEVSDPAAECGLLGLGIAGVPRPRNPVRRLCGRPGKPGRW